MLVDTHAHISDPKLASDIELVVERARQAGVTTIINVGDNVERSKVALAQAEQYASMWAAAAVHPHEADSLDDDSLEQLRVMAKNPKVIAIGEIGLDYYYDTPDRQVQKSAFLSQIELAREVGLPIIVHNREAHADTLSILKDAAAKGVTGVMHCFSGSYELATEFIRLGFYISIAGTVTFKNARRPAEVAAKIPLDRLLMETDCPYLAPVPFRGKRNEPAYLRYTAEKIAGLRGITLEQLAKATSENASRLFSI
ncbi:MAG TPA: TatD family hydrolase [Bacillota bacterium]|jgi:TatD DNase family protein|nr:TatD family hydrolase [Bacillota bacterium]